MASVVYVALKVEASRKLDRREKLKESDAVDEERGGERHYAEGRF
jgi:hypothetical protein